MIRFFTSSRFKKHQAEACLGQILKEEHLLKEEPSHFWYKDDFKELPRHDDPFISMYEITSLCIPELLHLPGDRVEQAVDTVEKLRTLDNLLSSIGVTEMNYIIEVVYRLVDGGIVHVVTTKKKVEYIPLVPGTLFDFTHDDRLVEHIISLNGVERLINMPMDMHPRVEGFLEIKDRFRMHDMTRKFHDKKAYVSYDWQPILTNSTITNYVRHELKQKMTFEACGDKVVIGIGNGGDVFGCPFASDIGATFFRLPERVGTSFKEFCGIESEEWFKEVYCLKQSLKKLNTKEPKIILFCDYFMSGLKMVAARKVIQNILGQRVDIEGVALFVNPARDLESWVSGLRIRSLMHIF